MLCQAVLCYAMLCFAMLCIARSHIRSELLCSGLRILRLPSATAKGVQKTEYFQDTGKSHDFPGQDSVCVCVCVLVPGTLRFGFPFFACCTPAITGRWKSITMPIRRLCMHMVEHTCLKDVDATSLHISHYVSPRLSRALTILVLRVPVRLQRSRPLRSLGLGFGGEGRTFLIW